MKDRVSNLPLLLAVALATTLGAFAGLHFILRGNGLGLLVFVLVSAITVIGIAWITRRERNANQREIRSNQLPKKRNLMVYGSASLLIGPLIAVGGGLVANWFDPLHPFDVVPNLMSLAILGVFVGLTFAVVMVITKFVW
ncbi:hypothetical protein SH449x_000809 [Pirellulaceae bacterium SH449]